MPHVAGGGLGSFNHRFAQPTRHVQQHEDHDYPADRFPFTYDEQHDVLSDQTDGILKRAAADGTAPPRDAHADRPANTGTAAARSSTPTPWASGTPRRRPTCASTPSAARSTGRGASRPSPATGENLDNPGDYRPLLRALVLSLDRWARDGATPPPSVYPTIASGTLVAWDQKSTGFPALPGVRYPEVIQQPPLLDLGPRWRTQGIIDRQPPRVLGDYRVLVARSGPDGNDLGCLLPPEVAVPLATYTGWNLRNRAAGAEGELWSLKGSYLPFAPTKAQRERTGDPRPSLAERYGTLETYAKELTAKCRELRAAGYLLDEDVERIVRRQRERAATAFDTKDAH